MLEGYPEKQVRITGVGQSEVGVRLTRHPLLLTVDAVKEAMAEAGLTIEQIDGNQKTVNLTFQIED